MSATTAETVARHIGTVVIFGHPYRIKEDITLTAVAPESYDTKGVEVLETRIGFIHAVDGRVATVPGYPMANCLPEWPNEDRGLTHPVAGLRLKADDYVAVIHYVRILAAGDWSLRGTTFTYHIGGSTLRQQSISDVRFIAHGTAGSTRCESRPGNPWLAGH